MTPNPGTDRQLITDDPRDMSGMKAKPKFKLPETSKQSAKNGAGFGDLPLFSWATAKRRTGQNSLDQCATLTEIFLVATTNTHIIK